MRCCLTHIRLPIAQAPPGTVVCDQLRSVILQADCTSSLERSICDMYSSERLFFRSSLSQSCASGVSSHWSLPATSQSWLPPSRSLCLAHELARCFTGTDVKVSSGSALGGYAVTGGGPCGPGLRCGVPCSHNSVVGSFVSLAGLCCAATHADLLMAVLSSRCPKPCHPTWQGSSC